MEIYGVIYKVRNLINGKMYIGQTTNFYERMHSHLSDAKHSRGYALHNAIRKYGEENFNWCIIDHAYSQQELDDKEEFWIDFYKTFRDYGRGYNLTTGGDSVIMSKETRMKISKANGGKNSAWYGKRHTEETKRKIGEGNKGKKHSEDTKRKISESRKKYVGKNHPMYGRKHSEETRRKMRENHKNGIYKYRGKEVVQLSLDGEFIAEYKTVKEAGLAIDGNRNYISYCCRGIKDNYRGYKWMFKDDYKNIKNSQSTDC